MDSLILIGILLLFLVTLVDCVVRLIVVWNMRKRKRAVKPLGVMENNAEGNDGNVNVNVNVNGDANANADAAGNEMLRNSAGTENGRDGEFDAV